jgi:Type I phosphodiesterase / nucleotide pyrophosphatase
VTIAMAARFLTSILAAAGLLAALAAPAAAAPPTSPPPAAEAPAAAVPPVPPPLAEGAPAERAPSPPAPADRAAFERATPVLHPAGRRLLLVMVDGLPVAAFDRALAERELPHLEALLASRPTVSTTALATFPSSTSPSLPEMLSGLYAGMSDPTAPGAVHAFDRETRRVVRYFTQPDAWEWPVPDLFDAAAAAGLTSITVAEGRWDGPQSILTRGAILRDAALDMMGFDAFDGDRGPVERLIRRLRQPDPPQVILLVFNSVDLTGHLHGPGSAAHRRALVETDELLGQLLEAMASIPGGAGHSLLDDTTVFLFGDHGMVPSGDFLNLQPTFQSRGLSTYDASTATQILLRERLGKLWARWPDVLLVEGGSNVTQVYLRRPSGGWEDDQPGPPEKARRAAGERELAEIAAELAEMPGVSQVMRPLGEGRVEVRAAGSPPAEIATRGEGHDALYAYGVPAGAAADPFGYLADPAVAPAVCPLAALADRCFLPRDAWLTLTAAAHFPGAVPLVAKALQPERFTGDLVITALPGHGFLKGQKGDHGNLEREAMITPFVVNGPGVVAGAAAPQVRLVDLYPTAAVALGADPHDPALADLDGRPLPFVRPPVMQTGSDPVMQPPAAPVPPP